MAYRFQYVQTRPSTDVEWYQFKSDSSTEWNNQSDETLTFITDNGGTKSFTFSEDNLTWTVLVDFPNKASADACAAACEANNTSKYGGKNVDEHPDFVAYRSANRLTFTETEIGTV